MRAEVQCGFHVAENPMAEMKEWRGWYKGSAEVQVGEAQLVLEDGTVGAINITRAMQEDSQGTFLGTGDPPAAG